MDVKPHIPSHLTTKQRILFFHRMGYPALKKMKQISIEIILELPHPTDVGWGFYGLTPVKPR